MHRLNSRLLAVLAGTFVLFAGVTCADSSTGPRSKNGLRAIVGFVPAFSEAAADVYRNLVSFAIAVNNIHVRLVRADGTVVVDTIIVVTPGQDSVVLQLNVPIRGSEEVFEANIELRDGDQVLFSGTQNVTARLGASSSAPPTITLTYTGPGATATTLDVLPDTAMSAIDTLVLRPVAHNANGQVVSNLALLWSVSDATLALVTADGVLKPTGIRGSVVATALLPTGITGSATINLIPSPASLALISGGGQSATVGAALAQPIVVEVLATDALPVAGASVSFNVTSGGGSASPTSAVTDANGRASVTFTLGSAAGPNTMRAAAGPLFVDVTATGTADAVATFRFLQQPTTATSVTPIAPSISVEARDAHGNRATSYSGAITLAIKSGTGIAGAVLGPNTAALTTNAVAGLATFDVQIDRAATGYQLTATASSFDPAVSEMFSINVGAPTELLIVNGDNQGSLKGAMLSDPILVQLRDAGGNNVPGQTVAFAVASGEGSLSTASANTDVNGKAGTVWTVGTAGSQTVTATFGSLSRSFTAFIAEKLVITQMPSLDPQSGVPFVQKAMVQLQDLNDNPVRRAGIVIYPERENVDMNLFVTGGDSLATTDADGIATFQNFALEGDAGIPFRVFFKRWMNPGVDPGIVSATTEQITLLPGPAFFLLADEKYVRVTLEPETPIPSFTVRTSDGYNALPDQQVMFTQLAGGCGIVQPTVTSNADGYASVDVSPAPVFTSCVIRATLAAPPAGHTPADTIRIAIVPVPVIDPDFFYRVWTGAATDAVTGAPIRDWTNLNNWYLGMVPAQNDRVFIPRMLGPNATPKILADTSTGQFVMETGGRLDLNGKELYVGDTLFADGEILGPGIVALGRPSTKIRGTIRALLEAGEFGCPLGNEYFVVGDLNVDELQINCLITLNENWTVNVKGDLKTMAPLPPIMSGELNQSDGTIIVGGNAIFAGSRTILGGGLLDIKGNFSFTGDSSSRVFIGSSFHVVRMSGDSPAEPGRQLAMNGPGRFGTIEIKTTGSGIVNFTSTTGTAPPISELFVANGAHAFIPANWTLVLPDGLLTLEAGGSMTIFGIPLPALTCSIGALVLGLNTGPIFCAPV